MLASTKKVLENIRTIKIQGASNILNAFETILMSEVSGFDKKDLDD
jgi:hypothetical protein